MKHWAEANCEEKGLEPTGGAMREILGEDVDFIRFPTMSQQDFAEQVVPSGILTADDALEIHQYFLRGIVSPNTKFPCTYRAGIVSNLLLHKGSRPFVRIGGVSVSTQAQKSEGLVEFVVEPRNVHLKGVRLLTSNIENGSFSAVIRLLDENGDEVEAKEGTFEGKVMTRNHGLAVTLFVDLTSRLKFLF